MFCQVTGKHEQVFYIFTFTSQFVALQNDLLVCSINNTSIAYRLGRGKFWVVSP